MPPPSPFHLKVLEASVTRVQLRLQLRDADGDRGLRLAHDVGGALLLLLELDLQLRQALLQARDVYLLGLQLVGEEVVDDKREGVPGLTPLTTDLHFKCIKKASETSTPNQNNTNNALTFEQAKSKCIDLGFKAGTESFGQCILKLAK